MAKPERRAGFTLVEMLVACALLAFTGVAVASALFAVARANELAAARAARPAEVLPWLAADAEAAFVPSGLAEGEAAMSLAHGGGDPLAPLFSWHLFAADAAGGEGPGGCGAAEVTWSLGRRRAGEPAELLRVSAGGNAEPVTNRLLAGEWTLQAVAVGEDGSEWTAWPPPGKEGEEDPPALPRAIRFALSGEGFRETRLATVFAASAVAAK